MQTQLNLFQFETPSMPNLDVSRCQARVINYETAATMVRTYHYAHRVPSIVLAVGMYVDDVLAGCVTYGTPAGPNAARSVCGGDSSAEVLELNRLFVFDTAGRNSESWLISQSFKLLARSAVLLSYADTAKNHIGYVYQATNWLYTGLSDPGGNFSRIEIGGVNRTSKSFYSELGSQSRKVILEHYPQAIFHPHTKKHRYVYFIGNRRQRRKLRQALKWPVLPYPKRSDNKKDQLC